MLMKIKQDLKEKGITSPDTLQLTEAIQGHLDKMIEKDDETKKGLEEEEKEQKKKITSEDIHEGFSSTVSGLAVEPCISIALISLRTFLENGRARRGA